jgi:hypothetical protein
MGSFVHVVYLFCGKNKLTTIRGLCGPLYNAFYPEIFSDNSGLEDRENEGSERKSIKNIQNRSIVDILLLHFLSY